MTEFERRVRAAIAALRKGEVATYGEVAEEAGHPGAARAVGNVLAGSEGLPWWRVVASDGRLAPGHEAEHERRLRREGVVGFRRSGSKGKTVARLQPRRSPADPP
ncbi:MAG TPA: MGMT family protein [Actinomycetota bacterium]|nr:MGMT family protein [Actinomycetota bacterium]